jgi:glycosyltransferase involved in cell wall biosynthesis
VVGERLRRFNGIRSETLYPPLFRPERFHCAAQNDEIVSVCRVENHKRQHLLIEAMEHVRTPVRLRLCGTSSNVSYLAGLKSLVERKGLGDRVILELGWIGEETKVERISNCLASAYAPLDEDSYGYPTLEAAAARKPTLTAWDSGGTLEFVRDGENGLIVEPTARAMAEGFDRLFSDKRKTAAMGQEAFDTVQTLNITWDHVLDRLLS